MKVLIKTIIALLGIFLIIITVYSQEDAQGSKDHPLLTRMPNFYIYEYEDNEFDFYEFYDRGGNSITVEGHKYVINYKIKEGAKAPSRFQIKSNYTNAIKKIGGTVLYEESDVASMKLEKSGMEIWILVRAYGEVYTLYIVEKGGLVQEVEANADYFAEGITQTGHVAIYGIYFDTGKADVKPESEPTLNEIAKLLNKNPSLKLYVVGHTDNIGDLSYNMKLSQARADSVTKILVSKYGIDAGKLIPYGVGPLSPLASNKTEEGRAKNRRVELVEQ